MWGLVVPVKTWDAGSTSPCERPHSGCLRAVIWGQRMVLASMPLHLRLEHFGSWRAGVGLAAGCGLRGAGRGGVERGREKGSFRFPGGFKVFITQLPSELESGQSEPRRQTTRKRVPIRSFRRNQKSSQHISAVHVNQSRVAPQPPGCVSVWCV